MKIFSRYDTLELLKPYKSPSNTSVFKGVPVALRERVLSYYKFIGIKVKLRYRGPRIHGTQSYCVLRDAKTFAVYVRTW